METALPDNIIMYTCRFVHDLILYVHMYVQYMNMDMDMYIHAQYMRLSMSCFFLCSTRHRQLSNTGLRFV